MPAIPFRSFGGEIPRLSAWELPDGKAAFAQNCDLAHGDLRGLRGKGQFANPVGYQGGPIKSVYTEDGVNFYAWTYEVYPVRSMVVGDVWFRFYYTAMQPDGVITKVGRTYRADGSANPPRVIGTAIVGGNFMPPENVISGQGGPDTWVLGVPAPQTQGRTAGQASASVDQLTPGLSDKPAWPGSPNLQFKVTYFLEDLSGSIVYQTDVSNLEVGLDAVTGIAYPPVMYTNNESLRGNKIQDLLWSFGKQAPPRPYKYYFFVPPTPDASALSRTVLVTNTGTGPILITYTGTAVADPAWTGTPGTAVASPVSVPITAGINFFTVMSATAVTYQGIIYEGVTDIAYPDGTHKTCAQLIQAAGGDAYSASELTACIKVQAVDPDAAGRQLFLAYSSNSHQTGNNATNNVEGGVTVDMFDFLGGANNPVNRLFTAWNPAITDPVAQGYVGKNWRGFKVNYGVSETRSYTMTQVNVFGEESVPSPPTNLDVTIMHGALLTGLFIPPASSVYPPSDPRSLAAQYVPIYRFKLYRAAVTSNGSFVYQRVPIDPISQPPTQMGQPGFGIVFPQSAYVVFGQTPGFFSDLFKYTFTDISTTDQLLESLPSLNWDEPKWWLLKGLTAWRNGMMAAYDKNTLYLCEPYRPFAWPQIYQKSLPFQIRGLRVDENALVAVTDQEPYIFNGSHPSNVTYEKLQGVQAALPPNPISAGVSLGGFVNPTRALVRTPRGVYYASREGMMKIQGGRAAPVFGSLFTREEWVQRYGAVFGQMRLAYYDNMLLCYFEGSLVQSGGGTNGFIVNIDDEEPRFVEYQGGFSQVADFVLPITDSLYIVDWAGVGSPSVISRFADENTARQTPTYTTRDVVTRDPVNFGCVQLVGIGQWQVDVYADGVHIGPTLNFTLPALAAGQVTQRLPSGFKARRWSVALVSAGGTALLSELYLAETRLELKSV